jgi:hypothetical protein
VLEGELKIHEVNMWACLGEMKLHEIRTLSSDLVGEMFPNVNFGTYQAAAGMQMPTTAAYQQAAYQTGQNSVTMPSITAAQMNTLMPTSSAGVQVSSLGTTDAMQQQIQAMTNNSNMMQPLNQMAAMAGMTPAAMQQMYQVR